MRPLLVNTLLLQMQHRRPLHLTLPLRLHVPHLYALRLHVPGVRVVAVLLVVGWQGCCGGPLITHPCMLLIADLLTVWGGE